jgi:serine/threonine protein kinase/tetratricopeptide (TPR) repeat protein
MPIELGDILEGRFAVERSVATGGMGEIFRAVDRQTGALVGVKTVRVAGGAERFQREIQILANLRHPGIVSYLAHGRVGDEFYLVMEWLEGEDLGTRLAAAELNVQEAVGVGVQVAAALEAVHRQGIVHRDVKPSNVFLTDWRLDRVKLLDYGVARQAGMETLTGTGSVIGTPAYMSPEQARGERAIDARADVYSLGALLFHCLAGRPPFEGDNPNEVMAAALHRPAPHLDELIEVNPALATLVGQMLEKDPRRRPADGAAVRTALAGIDVKGLAVTLPTPRPYQDPGRPSGGGPGRTAAERRGSTTLSSVAVLPFLDLSPLRDQAYLCDGIAEELINTLTQLESLRVAARSSSFQFKAENADVRAIGARLGVDAIVEGGVRKSGDRLRVTVQLVDVVNGSPRWSHRFDGTLDDVFEIQDQIAAGVAVALRGMLSPQERDALRRPETTPEAYEHFLRGRKLRAALTSTSFDAAEKEFLRAIELDPAYAPAHAGLAEVYSWSVEWLARGDTVRQAADRASQRALELAPELAESHVARGSVLAMEGDYLAAARAYQEAIRLNPNSFDAYYRYAHSAFDAGNYAESIELFRRAAELRPEDPQSAILVHLPLRQLGRTPEIPAAMQEGIRRAERQLELDPNDVRTLILGAVALMDQGQRERALEWGGRAVAIAPDEPSVLINAVNLYVRAGMKEEAMVCLERTYGRGLGKPEWLDRDADYDFLRDHPRFPALLARVQDSGGA